MNHKLGQDKSALGHPTTRAMARLLSFGYPARSLVPVEQAAEAIPGFFGGGVLLRATLISADGYVIVINLSASGPGLPALAPAGSPVPGVALYYPFGGRFVPIHQAVRVKPAPEHGRVLIYRQNPADVGARLLRARATDAELAAAHAARSAGAASRPRFLWENGGGLQVIRPGDRIAVPRPDRFDGQATAPTIGRVARVKAVRDGLGAAVLRVDIVTDDGAEVERVVAGRAARSSP